MSIGKSHILVVEDQLDVRTTLRIMLKQLGVGGMTFASNGEEASQIMQSNEQEIDLILCDWNMPKMSGLDFLKQVRAHDKAIPFLMITGRGDEKSILDARDVGVSAYILKPFSLGEIERKLEKILLN